MIPPPLAIPLASPPLPPPGERLSSFPPVSPVARNCPYTARQALPLCDTLAADRRGYKRPTRQRKRGQWFQPLRTTTQCARTRHRKRPAYAPPHAPRPATRDPRPATRPSAPVRSLPATGPPGSSATGPPAPQISGFPVSPHKVRVRLAPPCARIPPGSRENRRRTYTGQNRRWSVAGILEKSDAPPSRRGPRPGGNGLRGNTPRNPPRNPPQICRPIPAPRSDKGKQ
jgi:hypothetical protein